jgi:hypothetical protein
MCAGDKPMNPWIPMIALVNLRKDGPRLFPAARGILLVAVVHALIGLPAAWAAERPAISVDPSHGALRSLPGAGRVAALAAAGGGFLVQDAATKAEIVLTGTVEGRTGGGTVFKAVKDGDLELRAEFVPAAGFIRVNCSLTNLRGGERGMLVDYTVSGFGDSTVFGNSLNASAALKPGAPEQEGNVFPLGTIGPVDEAGQTAVALAIPPDAPCIFGVAGSGRGLTLRFYLGTSPETKRFTNRADFSFVIYPVARGWEFRRALAAYYAFFPEYYEVRTKKYGYLMFGAAGVDRPDLDFYTMNRVALGETLERDLKRDDAQGIASVVYTNVGTQELTRLPKMPENLDEAWQMYQEIVGATAEEWTQGGPDPTTAELIDSSACGLSSGRYVMSLRYTGWGQNSISFKTNPNPDLFGGTKRCIGDVFLQRLQRLHEEHPQLDGVCVDSLGANWPATLNYRHDHFPWARYPLTTDAQGRVALHNEISYCEFMDTLRAWLRSRGGLLYGNGLYEYPSRWTVEPEHYRSRGVTLGRFFLAARCDIGSSEAGTRATQGRFEFIRAAMGRKLYDLTNSEWEDAAATRDWFNRCLLYNIYGENTRRYDSDPAKIKPYHPEGYARDRETITWFMNTSRRLSAAGWEPVTLATVEAKGGKVLVERYGSGGEIYLAVMNDGKEAASCTLRLDLAALGLQAGHFVVTEVAQGNAVKVTAPDAVTLDLPVRRTSIIQLRPGS